MTSCLKKFIILFCISFNAFAEGPNIDSLKLELKNAKHDTTRCKILLKLGETAKDEESLLFTKQLLKLAEKNAASAASKTLKTFYLRYCGDAFSNLGLIANDEDNMPKAIQYFQKSLKFYEEIGDKQGIAIALNNIGSMYQNLSDIPKAMDYIKRSIKFYEEINDKSGLANTLNNIGLNYFNLGNHVTALDYFEKGLKIQEEINDKEGISVSLNNIAVIYNYSGDIIKALEYYQRSLKICGETNDKATAATTLSNIAAIYDKQGDIPKALEYHHKSLRISEEIKNKRGIAESLNFIGLIYFQQEDLNKALEYYQKSFKIKEEIGDKMGVSISLNNFGLLYKKQKNISKALEYFNKSLKIKEEIGDKFGIAYTLRNIGVIYDDEHDFWKAMQYYKKGLKIKEEMKDKEGIAQLSGNMANALLLQGQTDAALKFATNSLILSEELGFPSNINYAAFILKKIYTKQSKYKEAFDMYKLEIRMRDSINNEVTKKAAIKKQFQYIYEKQAAADSVKNVEIQKIKIAEIEAKDAQIKQEKTQRYALYGGLAMIIVLAGFVVNRLNVARKQKAIIEEQKEEVDKAFEQLHEKNKEVMDSINYARRIQASLLPTEKYISKKTERR